MEDKMIGQYLVCGGHGVGQITDIEIRDIRDNPVHFYIVKLVSTGMVVMVPTDGDTHRSLIDNKQVDWVYKILKDETIKVSKGLWNERYRKYMELVRKGDIFDIAGVAQELRILSKSKCLSFGERKLLDQCKDLIATELSIVTDTDKSEILKKIGGNNESINYF